MLDDIPALLLNETEARKLRQGQKLKFDTLRYNDFFIFKYPNYQEFEKVYAISKNKLTAIVKIEDGLVKPKRIINNQTERKKDVD